MSSVVTIVLLLLSRPEKLRPLRADKINISDLSKQKHNKNIKNKLNSYEVSPN